MNLSQEPRAGIRAFLQQYFLPIAFSLSVLGVIALWLVWGLFGVKRFHTWICPGETCTSLGQVGDIFGGINALFAAFALAFVGLTTDMTRRANLRQQKESSDQLLFEQVGKSYEWAYAAIAPNNDAGPPKCDRLAWLTAARHLLRAEKISKRIEGDTFRLINEEENEYWRHRFYLLLDTPILADPAYYGPLGRPKDYYDDTEIDLTSAMVVYTFSKWKKGSRDPLHSVNLTSMIQQDGGLESAGTRPVSRGIREYLNLRRNHIKKEMELEAKPPDATNARSS